MTTNINKIRDGRLTEDAKMEIIADYLENGGGSGSNKVVIRVEYNTNATASDWNNVYIIGSINYGELVNVPGYSFKNQETNEAMTPEEVFELLEDGAEVIFNNVPFAETDGSSYLFVDSTDGVKMSARQEFNKTAVGEVGIAWGNSAPVLRPSRSGPENAYTTASCAFVKDTHLSTTYYNFVTRRVYS